MSSKEQYKDVVKRQKKVIVKLTIQTDKMAKELKIASDKVYDLIKAIEKAKLKKWWQFWK